MGRKNKNAKRVRTGEGKAARWARNRKFKPTCPECGSTNTLKELSRVFGSTRGGWECSCGFWGDREAWDPRKEDFGPIATKKNVVHFPPVTRRDRFECGMETIWDKLVVYLVIVPICWLIGCADRNYKNGGK
jgi:hypothetical protein